MRNLTILSFLIISTLTFGQKKIASDTYLYGDFKGKINDKVMIYYGFDDPKGELDAVKIFTDVKLNVLNYSAIFLPGQTFTKEEEMNIFNKESINTIILIKHVNTSTETMTYNNFNYSNLTKSVYSSGGSGGVVGTVSIILEVYTKDDNFSKPIATIKSKGTNNWGIGGTERGVINGILKKVSSAIMKNK